MADLVLFNYDGWFHPAILLVTSGFIGLVGGTVARSSWGAGWGFLQMFLLTCILGGIASSVTALARSHLVWGEGVVLVFVALFYVLVGGGAAAVGFLAEWYFIGSSEQRRDSTHCQHCDYSLRGLTGDPIRCPECGEVQQTGAES